VRTAILALATWSLTGCVAHSLWAQATLPAGGREYHDVAYEGGAGFDTVKHRLDLFVPAPGDRRRPVIVFVHGGGWVFGDRKMPFDGYGKLGRRLASRGFVTAVISYRLAPGAKHPAQVQDVAAALRWVRDHAAQYGGDPHRMFAMGHSAGAQLVALVGTDPRWLQAQGLEPSDLAGVIAISGPYDVKKLGSSLFIGGPIVIAAFGRDRAVWADATPATHLRDGHPPPFFLSYADADFPMLRDYARAFARELHQAGVPVTLRELPFQDHFTEIADLGEPGDVLAAEIEAFIAAPAGPGAQGERTSQR
jgi:acetyl esterase/lipase